MDTVCRHACLALSGARLPEFHPSPAAAVTAEQEMTPLATPRPVPTPAEVARLTRRKVLMQDASRVRQLECLPCEQVTEHVPGPATRDKNGVVLVQWWKCVECTDGHTVG